MNAEVEYYLKNENKEMLLGSIRLNNAEDEDDAFPRFMIEEPDPFRGFKDIFNHFYNQLDGNDKSPFDIASYKYEYWNTMKSRNLIPFWQHALEVCVDGDFKVIAYNLYTHESYVILQKSPDIPDWYRGHEATLKFMDIEYFPDH